MGGGLSLGLGLSLKGAASSFNPSQLPDLIGWWDAGTVTTASGDVLAAPSYRPGPTLKTYTVARRPALTAGRIVFDAANTERLPTVGVLDVATSTTLPDGASGSTAGKGFTNTGIAKAGDGTWRFGNYGKPSEATSGATTFATSVVKTSAAFAFTSEVTGASLGATQNLTVAGFQGIAFAGDGTLWGAMPESNTVYHWTDGGGVLGTQTFTGCNGLGYDLANGQVVVCAAGTNPTVVWKDPVSWASIKQRVLTDTSIDGIYVSADGATLWGSGGFNGTAGRLIKLDVATSNFVNYTLIGCPAVESFDITGTTVTMNTDNFYHAQGASPTNRVLTYDLGADTPLPYVTLGNKIIMGGVFKAAAVPGTTSCFMSIGEPLTATQAGLGIFFGSTGDLRIIADVKVASFTDGIATEHLRIYVVDLVALTVDCWIDGVAQAQKTLTGATFNTLPALPVIMGACVEASIYTRHVAASMANFMIGLSGSVADRLQIEGKLAWDATHDGSLLPAGHPYKDHAP